MSKICSVAQNSFIWLFVLCKHIFLIYIFTEPADGARQYGSSLPCPVDWGKTWTLCFIGNSSRDLGVALCFLMSHRICLSLCKPLSSKWQNHCFYSMFLNWDLSFAFNIDRHVLYLSLVPVFLLTMLSTCWFNVVITSQCFKSIIWNSNEQQEFMFWYQSLHCLFLFQFKK